MAKTLYIMEVRNRQRVVKLCTTYVQYHIYETGERIPFITELLVGMYGKKNNDTFYPILFRFTHILNVDKSTFTFSASAWY